VVNSPNKELGHNVDLYGIWYLALSQVPRAHTKGSRNRNRVGDG
jgi:hypothetical protein